MGNLLAELPLHVQAIGGLIFVLALLFLGFFVAPALRIHWTLSRLLKSLSHEELKGPVDLAHVFEGKGILQHLWNEFRETLHEERALNPQTGAQEIARLRHELEGAAHD